MNMFEKTELEKDLRTLRDQVMRSFGIVTRPATSTIRSLDDFEHIYAAHHFKDLGVDFYNFDDEEVLYLMRFAMLAYVDHYAHNEETNLYLTQFLLWFQGYRVSGIVGERYKRIYRRFDYSQKKCICSFLSLLRRHRMDEGYVDQEDLDYWCMSAQTD